LERKLSPRLSGKKKGEIWKGKGDPERGAGKEEMVASSRFGKEVSVGEFVHKCVRKLAHKPRAGERKGANWEGGERRRAWLQTILW